ncbi:hypothetical protein C8J56DRAFT_1170591 [Mycena floridula]|nr:hypothetical protein C8J56DRAFT_1170591 [Mycena floridula]
MKLFALVSVAAAFTHALGLTLIDNPPPSRSLVPGALILNGTVTDTTTIDNTVAIVNQKSGPSGAPNQPVPPVFVTALDGKLTHQAVTRRDVLERTSGPSDKRSIANYTLIFSGTGVSPNDRDGSIEGTAFLTFTTVNNSTYNIEACLDFCDGIEQCVFVNLYYEFNNPGLVTSNLKCAAYADIHNATEKTNRGGQQLALPPIGVTYIQQSSGYAAKSIENPATPEGFELVFGPINGANNAPGFMGFAFLDRYDVQACTDLCRSRGADPNGGGCQFVNIWRALVDGIPTTYTCSFYYIPADQSSAVNTGQGDLQVTFSRGYRRISVLPDGGFESFSNCKGKAVCFTESDANWIGACDFGGQLDAVIFDFPLFAHSGHSAVALGSANGFDNHPGSFTAAHPLTTKPGRNYVVQLFHGGFVASSKAQKSSVTIKWNGQTIGTISAGNSPWTFFQFPVKAKGKDTFSFTGGSFPAYDFLDDIFIFLA